MIFCDAQEKTLSTFYKQLVAVFTETIGDSQEELWYKSKNPSRELQCRTTDITTR